MKQRIIKDRGRRHGLKGAIVAEFAFLSFVVLSVSLFFWSLHSNISDYSQLDALIYESIVDVKDELYLYSKVEEYLRINQNLDDVISKIEKRIHLELDETELKNTIASAALNRLIEQKIKRAFHKRYTGDLKTRFHLKKDPEVKTSVQSGNLVVKTRLYFDLPSVISFLDEFVSCVHYEVGCRNIEKILFEEDGSSDANKSFQKGELILTKNGLFHSKVYHTDKDCFGLQFAKTVTQVDDQQLVNGQVMYRGERFHQCYFCKIGKKRGK